MHVLLASQIGFLTSSSPIGVASELVDLAFWCFRFTVLYVLFHWAYDFFQLHQRSVCWGQIFHLTPHLHLHDRNSLFWLKLTPQMGVAAAQRAEVPLPVCNEVCLDREASVGSYLHLLCCQTFKLLLSTWVIGMRCTTRFLGMQPHRTKNLNYHPNTVYDTNLNFSNMHTHIQDVLPQVQRETCG